MWERCKGVTSIVLAATLSCMNVASFPAFFSFAINMTRACLTLRVTKFCAWFETLSNQWSSNWRFCIWSLLVYHQGSMLTRKCSKICLECVHNFQRDILRIERNDLYSSITRNKLPDFVNYETLKMSFYYADVDWFLSEMTQAPCFRLGICDRDLF